MNDSPPLASSGSQTEPVQFKHAIVTGDDPVLFTVAKPVLEITPNLRELVEHMFESVTERQGAGLAAPQLGVSLRIMLARIGLCMEVCMNPEILRESGSQCNLEGCFSRPGVWGNVMRPYKVKARWIDLVGNIQHATLKGKDAMIFCHEVDHLNGVIFTSKMTPGAIEKNELLRVKTKSVEMSGAFGAGTQKKEAK